jgi:hypothetical protein
LAVPALGVAANKSATLTRAFPAPLDPYFALNRQKDRYNVVRGRSNGLIGDALTDTITHLHSFVSLVKYMEEHKGTLEEQMRTLGDMREHFYCNGSDI